MIKKLSLIVISFVFTLALVGGSPVLAEDSLFSGSKDAACGGSQATDNPVQCDATSSAGTVNTLIKTGLNIFSLIVGVAAVIMIMIGGFKFITSQGDGNSTAAARNTILYAIIGLVVVALAQFVVRYVMVKLQPKPAAPPTSLSRPLQTSVA